MIDLKIIKTEAEYEQALARIEALMDAFPGSPQEDELELLALLVENYEHEHFPIDMPDPIEAIKFCMEQEGLEPKDMVKYLGSQSKVSEVLNYKRPLSLTMIRNLNEGLSIPAEVLLQRTNDESEENPPSLQGYPFTEMLKRNYFHSFKGTLPEAKREADALLAELLSVFERKQFHPIYCKQSERAIDTNALSAWQARCMHIASQKQLPPFSQDDLSENFFRQLVKLSYFEDGPRLVKEFLNKKGIHLVTLSHLPKTYLDGACWYGLDQQPIIAMTLRYNRLDNFWFTLIHELAHLYLHMDDSNLVFFDDTEQLSRNTQKPQEQEANDFTMEIFIPRQVWNENKDILFFFQDPQTLIDLADRLEINPAIIAGRVHWEKNDYSIFPDLVGSNKVRKNFPEFV